MTKLHTIITAYISSKNDQEALVYENKLFVFGMIPILLLASIMNVVIFAFLAEVNPIVLTNSAVCLLFAVVLALVLRLKINDRLISFFIAILFVAILSFLVLRFYQSVGTAVWTISFIFVLFAMTRNGLGMVNAIILSVALLGVYIWLTQQQFVVSAIHNAAQFIAFGILYAVAAGVKKIHAERLKKIRYYLNESEMVSQISSGFITVNAENIDMKINAMLAKSGTYYGADVACICLFSKDGQKLQYTHEWCHIGTKPMLGFVEDFDVRATDWITEQIESKKGWFTSNVDALDIGEVPRKPELQAVGIKSMISMPIVVMGKVYGSLFYETLNDYMYWTPAHIKLLDVLANMVGDAFSKVESEKEINDMAYYDTLTGLPNRTYFNQRLQAAIDTAQSSKTRLAVMFIDLDSFKSVNDAIGHEGGDALLRLVGTRLSEQLGAHGLVGRMGGDEFMVLLTTISETADIKAFADQVMAVFYQHMTVENQEFFVTASAGIAVYPEDGVTSVALRKNADLAMYAAKELGKNQAVFCTPKLKDDIEKKVRISNLLHRALEKGELNVYYQPLVDIATKEITGAEALLRWMSPELGTIPPSVFIPLAEQTGLIFPIGKWVLKESCRQNKAWQDAGLKNIRIAVNLSIEQFRRADIVDMISESLEETGLDPRYLELEITESVASKEPDYICGILEAIKKLGVSISIDDFGTEYSSLARIKRLPVNRLKMAMEFVHGISVSEKDEAIAKTIINLADNLGLKIIAEGVETEAQYAFLKSRVCGEVQGYYFFRPMPPAEMIKVLSEENTGMANVPHAAIS